MKIRWVLFLVVVLTVGGCSTWNPGGVDGGDDAVKTELLYNRFVHDGSPDIAQLTLFFTKMPKGGDLHHHYSGSIYAETYLDWVEKADFRINKNTLKIGADKENDLKIDICKADECITVQKLRSETGLYRQLLTLWSDLDFGNHFHLQPPPDSNFFNTFGYFGPISGYSINDGLKIIARRARKENVSYIETQLKSVGYWHGDESFDADVRKTENREDIDKLLSKLTSTIDSDPEFKKDVDGFVEEVEKAAEGVDDDRFLIRYQTYTSRNSPPSTVFGGLYAAFTAAEASDLIVGVNFVGPENGVTAIADYLIHMEMFSYLKKLFPNVNVALHAGELTLGMVRPKDLTFHIAKAIETGGARRIGHGIDLPHEENAVELLGKIKEKDVAVEINLTSNEFILGVRDQQHPYLIYAAYDVPLVISTDDSGVSRNNLSGEYVLLASRYKPGYKTIKKYVYNSIEYSFLPDRDKTELKKSLDARFERFEREMADYYDSLFE